MFLKRLYSEPFGLFRSGRPEQPNAIVFTEGFNFIFGKKDNVNDSKESLNGLGKSTICDLIDFCLLADFNKNNTRLFKERNRMEGYSIVLEFEVEGVDYILKRRVEDPKSIEFGRIGDEKEVPIKEAKHHLFKLVFDNPKYVGILDENWFRALLSFFMKIHKRKNLKDAFSDPINFLTANNPLYQINPYHFFLLGLDNTLLCENFKLQKDVLDRKKAISQVKKIVEKNYNLNINQVDSQLSKLRNEVKRIKNAIDAFKLADQHRDVEVRLNELTGNIKMLSEQNFWIAKKIKSYKESFELKDTISDSKIKNIEKLYAELNEYFKGVISKSLNEAVEFRKKIAHSREAFLKDEILELEARRRTQEKEIQELDSERQNLFSLLKSREAFKDLTEAFYVLGEKEKEISDLDGKVTIYRDLQAEKAASDAQDAILKQSVITFLVGIHSEIDEFEALFAKVYQAIYPETESSGFSITPNYEADKVKINIAFDKDESKGWNKGRTLVYDISVMINAIIKNIRTPRFLIHDGVFDGMDKAHFVHLYHFVQDLQEQGIKFQYIVTMIEEGQLSESFGKTDALTTDKISEQAIAILTKNNPFWIG